MERNASHNPISTEECCELCYSMNSIGITVRYGAFTICYLDVVCEYSCTVFLMMFVEEFKAMIVRFLFCLVLFCLVFGSKVVFVYGTRTSTLVLVLEFRTRSLRKYGYKYGPSVRPSR